VLVRAGDIDVHCVVEGPDDAPWVVLSNSLATTLAMWDDVVPRLTEHFRVLRYDQRGHGGTTVTPAPYAFDVLTGDLARLLDAFGIDQAHLVGLSMGGVTVLGLALLAPERVTSLVVCDTSAASTPAAAAQWADRAELARREGMSALVAPTVDRWFPAATIAADSPAVGHARRMIADTPAEGFRGGAAALSDVGLASSLDQVKAPTLFIVGSEDGVLPAAMLALHQRVPGSRYTRIPGAGHLSALEQPEAFARELTGFFLKGEVS
jgi:3-oxoadipate enol-lactonase